MNNQGCGKHGHGHGHGGKHHGHGGHHHGHHGHRQHHHHVEKTPSQEPNFQGQKPRRHHWGRHGGWHHFKTDHSHHSHHPWNHGGFVPPMDNTAMSAVNQHTWNINNQSTNALQNEQSLAPKKVQTSEPPAYILCPITQTIMTSPVILKTCGHSFDEKAIRHWLHKSKPSKCPLCKTPASEDSIGRNFALADAVEQFLSKNKI